MLLVVQYLFSLPTFSSPLNYFLYLGIPRCLKLIDIASALQCNQMHGKWLPFVRCNPQA